jgi:HEAT repeat protein
LTQYTKNATLYYYKKYLPEYNMGLFRPNIEKLIDNDDVDGLLKQIKNRRADIRLGSFLALSRKQDPKIIEQLKTLLKDPDPRVRAVATLKFGDFSQEGIIENLRTIIISGSQREKIEALRLIASKGETDDPDISKILFLALNDGKMMIQLEAMKTMGAIKDKYSVKHLIEKLDERKYQTRLEAVKALGQIRDLSSTDPLIGSLIDNNIEVRRAAQEALRKIGTDKALNAINDAPFMLLVKRMTEGEAIRRDTVRQIGYLKMREALPLLQKACIDEFKNIRLESVHSIGILREPGAVHTVVKLLDDPFYDVRIEAVRALEKIFSKESLAGLEKAMKDSNKNVRLEAQQAFYSLKNRIEKAEEFKMI